MSAWTIVADSSADIGPGWTGTTTS
jgi:hypothetical protein